MPVRATSRKHAIFRQVCELIPSHLVPKLARKHGIQSRGITPWSHTVSMLFAQFTHAMGLNDVVDALRANRSSVATIRGAEPPSRNGLSHANRTRSPEMAKDLFWSVLHHFEALRPGFGGGEVPTPASPFQKDGPCTGLDDDQAVCLLHGLGEAPTAQGGGQASPAAEPG